MKTMLKPLLVIAMCALPFTITAQVTIGSGSAPAGYSLLDLDTRNVKGGLRLPQLQGADIDNFRALVEADTVAALGRQDYVEGLLFYNMDTHCLEFWSGTIWEPLCGDSVMMKMVRHISRDWEEPVCCDLDSALFKVIWDSIASLQQYIDTLETRIHTLETFTELSDITDYVVSDTRLPGLGVSVIRNGFNHNFWGTGTVNGSLNLSNNTTYRLITTGAVDDPANGVCYPLTLYQGAPTIGTLWIQTTSGDTYSLPIYFDNTGIYIQMTTSMNLGTNPTFRFTQSLILVDPNFGF